VDEHLEELSVEHDEQDQQAEEWRELTQRELVRASLLRCPPTAAGDPPRH
jgi:hypothetical protein